MLELNHNNKYVITLILHENHCILIHWQLNCLFKVCSGSWKNTRTLHYLREEKPPGIGEFPSQRSNNTKNFQSDETNEGYIFTCNVDISFLHSKAKSKWTYIHGLFLYFYYNQEQLKIVTTNISISHHVNGLVQEIHNSIANALELCLSCTYQSMYSQFIIEALWG